MTSSLARTGNSVIQSKSQHLTQRSSATNREGQQVVNESRISHDSFNEQFQGRDQKDFINEANKIMRERMKNKGSTINSKSRLKSVILNDTKEVCLKNYLIGWLKEKRTDINEKERNITNALKESEKRWDVDYKDFVKFVEDTKNKQKQEEEDLASLKAQQEDKNGIEKKETAEWKKNSEDLEKIVRMIGIFKSYGSFVHKVLNEPFAFDEIPQLEPDSRERNFENWAEIILKNFDKLMNTQKPELLTDVTFLLLKFTELEEKVIKIWENKEALDKEMKKKKMNDDNELSEWEHRLHSHQEEEKRIKNEKIQMKSAIDKLKPQKNSEVDQYLKYIAELSGEIGVMNIKTKGHKTIEYINDIIDTLKNKERKVNNFINEIESYEINGSDKDKENIKNIELDRKKENKKEKQLLAKQKQDHLDNIKRQRAVDRAQRVVIKGRKVPKEYPILKEKKKKSKISKNDDDDDFDFSDEDNNTNNY